MKERLLDMLVCPLCGGALSLEVWRGSAARIVEGLLPCPCGEAFPVIEGVPRMLPGALRPLLRQDYASFFSANRRRLPPCLLPATPLHATVAEKTQSSFGFEWTRFSTMRPEWETNFWDYMAPHTADFLRGKTILDAGCGMGRQCHPTPRWHGNHAADLRRGHIGQRCGPAV